MTLRILLIDDNPDDRLLAIRELSKAFVGLPVEEISEAPAYEQALAGGNFDLVITDYRLRWNDGISVLRDLKARYPAVPVVMFTNSGNEEVAVEAMKAGLDDYVLKSPKHYFRLALAVRSVLEQGQQRQALKAAETRYSNLFDRIPIGLYRTTPEGEILEANPALAQLLGYPNRQALLDRNSENFYLEVQARQQWREQMERDDVVRDFEVQFRTIDGKTIWVRHNARAIRDRNGKILYYEGAIEDVSDRKQAEEERKALLEREQAARAQAEAASRMKDEFLAILSHELRTPLNAILGWATLLRTRTLDAVAINRALETIERNAKTQTQMIEDLLDVSRIIRGKLRLSFSPVNLVTVVDAAMDAVQPAAIAKKIALEHFIDPSVNIAREQVERWAGEQGRVGDKRTREHKRAEEAEEAEEAEGEKPIQKPKSKIPTPLFVLGDLNRLQQVFWNLLTNAIKFTPAGGKVEVRLSVVMKNSAAGTRQSELSLEKPTTNYQLPITSYAQIQVSDTGQGISPDFLPYIFEYFRQADSSSTRSHGGLGLGLAIVRQLVELHGGTVSADSLGDGQGATFTVRLPLLEGGQGDKDEKQGENSTYDVRRTTYDLPLEGVEILVVDDEFDSREFLAFALEQYGATVTAVTSAAQAKSAIAQSEPDILLSDIAMPEEDGYELVLHLRSQGKQIPAIALTAYARESDRNAAIAAGFQKHLSKPIDPEQLVALVADLVKTKQKKMMNDE